MIEIENKKLHDWIVEKDRLVDEGRANERDIAIIEKKIADFEKKEKIITGKIQPDKDLREEGDKLIEEVNKTMKRLEELGKLIQDKKLEAVPKEMKDEHVALMKEREEKERLRNKIALKVQKVKDRCIPLIQKEVKPLLRVKRMVEIDIGKFDDIETAKTKNGKVVFQKYNRLEEFMQKFK
jgi:hypothetical protein